MTIKTSLDWYSKGMADWVEGVPDILAQGVVARDMETLRAAAPGLERNIMEVLIIEVWRTRDAPRLCWRVVQQLLDEN